MCSWGVGGGGACPRGARFSLARGEPAKSPPVGRERGSPRHAPPPPSLPPAESLRRASSPTRARPAGLQARAILAVRSILWKLVSRANATDEEEGDRRVACSTVVAEAQWCADQRLGCPSCSGGRMSVNEAKTWRWSSRSDEPTLRPPSGLLLPRSLQPRERHRWVARWIGDRFYSPKLQFPSLGGAIAVFIDVRSFAELNWIVDRGGIRNGHFEILHFSWMLEDFGVRYPNGLIELFLFELAGQSTIISIHSLLTMIQREVQSGKLSWF